jgi:Trypsin-co-occurring domain 1
MNRKRIILSNGAAVWIEEAPAVAEEEVAKRRSEGHLAEVLPSLVTLCDDLQQSLKSIAPKRAVIEFGITFTVEASGLALLITKAGAEANFKVSLEWEGQEPPPGRSVQ